MTAIQGNQNTGTLRENPMTLEEKAKLETSEMLEAKYSNPDSLDGEKQGLKKSLGGIGEIDAETGKEIAQSALSLEQEEAEQDNPEDVLNQLEGGSGEETIVGSIGEDSTLGEIQNITAENGGSEINQNISGTKSIETQEISPELASLDSKIDEHPDAPLVNRLGDNMLLIPEEVQEIKIRLNDGEPFSEIIESIQDIPDDFKANILTYYEKYSDTTEASAEKRQKDFSTDFDTSTIEEIGISEERQERILSEIGTNYISSGDESERQADLDIALARAINQNIEVAGESFHRTLEFDVHVHNAKNTDLSLADRIEAYSDALSLIDNDIGGKGSKNKEAQGRNRKLQLKNSGLQEKYQEAQAQLKVGQIEGNKQRVKEANEQIKIILEEANIVMDSPLGNFDTAMEVGGEEISQKKETV